MRKYILEFLRRGAVACVFGPIILVVIYMILKNTSDLQTVNVSEVCFAIISLSALAFIIGGMNVLYQIERLPLTIAIFIHGVVLYLSYMITYLINNWLKPGLIPFLMFTGIFIVGYPAIWVIIYTVVKKNTASVNEKLKQKQQDEDNDGV